MKDVQVRRFKSAMDQLTDFCDVLEVVELRRCLICLVMQGLRDA